MGYFRQIFRSQGTLNNALQEVTDAISPKVSPEMNADILKP